MQCRYKTAECIQLLRVMLNIITYIYIYVSNNIYIYIIKKYFNLLSIAASWHHELSFTTNWPAKRWRVQDCCIPFIHGKRQLKSRLWEFLDILLNYDRLSHDCSLPTPNDEVSVAHGMFPLLLSNGAECDTCGPCAMQRCNFAVDGAFATMDCALGSPQQCGIGTWKCYII